MNIEGAVTHLYLLDKISSPHDLKDLSRNELKLLSGEIRKRIVDVVSQKGGHLASSLGAVELTVALHYVFDTPKDKIIWDVEHVMEGNGKLNSPQTGSKMASFFWYNINDAVTNLSWQ